MESTAVPPGNDQGAIETPRTRPKRNAKPPARLQVGMETNKRYTEICESATDIDNSGDEREEDNVTDISQSNDSESDGEWYSGNSSAGSIRA